MIAGQEVHLQDSEIRKPAVKGRRSPETRRWRTVLASTTCEAGVGGKVSSTCAGHKAPTKESPTAINPIAPVAMAAISNFRAFSVSTICAPGTAALLRRAIQY
jgi:hypothetical protein